MYRGSFRQPLPALALAALLGLSSALRPQTPTSGPPAFSTADRQITQAMLDQLRDALRQHYYNPSFGGVDMDQRYALCAAQLKAAPNLGDAFLVLASYLAALRDSHTFFIPPALAFRFDYGLRLQLIGDRAFVTAVRPGSDAAAQLQPGDEILSLNGFTVNRLDFSDLNYSLATLSPVSQLHLLVRDPNRAEAGAARLVTVQTRRLSLEQPNAWLKDRPASLPLTAPASREQQRSLLAGPAASGSGDVFVWRIPSFDGNLAATHHFMALARKHSALVLDLRGNPGGDVGMMLDLLGGFLPANVKVADLVGREKQPALYPTPRGPLYAGKLIILVDASSASAAEIVARALQLAHRATIVGDQTEGAVMESQYFPLQVGVVWIYHFGAAITREDLIMSDGQRLEGRGVTPDILVLPTAQDLAAGRDPALSAAVALAGAQLDPTAAAQAFPYAWPPLPTAHN